MRGIKMKTFSIKNRVFLLTIFLILFVAGCSKNNESSGESKEPKKDEKVTLTIGDISAAEMIAPMDIAIEKGFFEEEGIIIEKKVFANGPTLMMSMANGDVDVAVKTGYTPMLQAASQGADIMIVASMAKNNAPVVASGDIKSFKDLDGKVIGTPGIGTIQNTMLSVAEAEYGIKFKQLIHAKVTDLPTLLEKGEIDGFTSWEWVAADAVNRIDGAHYVLENPVIENAESVGLAFNGDIYRENKEVVKKFLKAYLRGIEYFTENNKESIDNIAKKIGKPNEVIETALKAVSMKDPKIDMPSVKFAVEDAIATGKISKAEVPDVDKFMEKYIDNTILDQLKP
ncbi:ABC transporter substrate-binding protein [Rhodococcus qingshengii]|jgi:NitT/TauT family transport system substrate-binding protein|nr:ABC transporter substrate-binding protein [Rhodococcus qingshengii]